MHINEINVGTLAYLGDSVYEVEIRSFLVSKMNVKAHTLKEESIKYVSAKNQALVLEKMLDDNVLSEEEIDVVKRARNYKPNSKPKYTDIVTYKKASALEALFGYLYINNNQDRIKELIKKIVGE